MGVTGKLQVEVDIKSSGDLFYELCAKEPHHLSNVIPSIIIVSELREEEGDFAKPGSIFDLVYNLDRKKCISKKLVKEIDDEKKYLKLDTMEGPFLQQLKSLAIILQVVHKGHNTGVKWIVEFEKIDDNGPYPIKIVDLLIAITKGIEKNHSNAK